MEIVVETSVYLKEKNITEPIFTILCFLVICVFTGNTPVPYSNTHIQQDSTLHSIFYLATVLHVSAVTCH
jgi:hypothetical protein